MIGYVPQELILFHASVRENLTLGDDAYDERAVMEALRWAGAEDFVAQLPADSGVLVLDPSQDGVRQVADALQGFTGVQELHVLGHGATAEIGLGSVSLDGGNVGQYQDQGTRH